jgi:hypothetical protein
MEKLANREALFMHQVPDAAVAGKANVVEMEVRKHDIVEPRTAQDRSNIGAHDFCSVAAVPHGLARIDEQAAPGGTDNQSRNRLTRVDVVDF